MSDTIALTIIIHADSFEYDPPPDNSTGRPMLYRGQQVLFKIDSNVAGIVNVKLEGWGAEPSMNDFSLTQPSRNIQDPPQSLPVWVTVGNVRPSVYTFSFPVAQAGRGLLGETKQGEVEVVPDPEPDGK